MFWNGAVTDSQYCAYDPTFKSDTCKGDSGGPLQLFYPGSNMPDIVGIASYGKTSCPSMAPDIFTKVPYYLDWIQSHVWPNETPMKYFNDKNINDLDSGVSSVSVTDDISRNTRRYVQETYSTKYF